MEPHCILRGLTVTMGVLSSRAAVWTWFFWMLKALMFVLSRTDSGWATRRDRWKLEVKPHGRQSQVGFWAVRQAGFWYDSSYADHCHDQEGCFWRLPLSGLPLPASWLDGMNNHWMPLHKSLSGIYWAVAVGKPCTDRCGGPDVTRQALSLPWGSS